MPQFNLYYFSDNFSEHIQDDILGGEMDLSGEGNRPLLPSIAENGAISKKYENFTLDQLQLNPWSKGGFRHLVPRMLADFNSKKRKE